MDLFGDIDDISSESDGDHQPPVPEQPADKSEVFPNQQNEEPVSETRIEVEVPNVSSDLGNELYFVKLPKFLSIEPKPFDPQYYEDEFEGEKVLDEEERIRLKLKIENTIRWRIRQDEEGNKIKESNTRIVRWSDGSLSLHLGSEVFDVYKAPIQGNHIHLFTREDTGLQGQAIFKSKLTFRPHSTDCATHKKMTVPLANKASRTQKIRIIPMARCNPECQHPEMTKKEGLKASTHQVSHQQGLSTACQASSSDDDEEEEQARSYSSDSVEGLEDEAQRLLKTKKLRSVKVNLPEREQRVKRKKSEV